MIIIFYEYHANGRSNCEIKDKNIFLVLCKLKKEGRTRSLQNTIKI